MLYKIATFLNPKLCQLKMIGDNKRQSVIHAVKVLVDELGFDEESTEENLTATCHLLFSYKNLPCTLHPSRKEFSVLQSHTEAEMH